MTRLRTACQMGILLALLVGPIVAQEAPKRRSSASGTSSPGIVSSPDSGSLANGVYRNSTFGFTCKVPFGWVERTAEMRETDPPQANEPVKSLVLLAVFERPPEATGSTINSAIVIAAERVSQFSGLKTAADYFGPITELATAKGFTATFQPHDFPIGAKQLVRGDFSKPRGTLTMYQTSLVMMEKGYAVSFTFIGGSEDEVEGLVGNLTFGVKRPSR